MITKVFSRQSLMDITRRCLHKTLIPTNVSAMKEFSTNSLGPGIPGY